MKATRTGRPRRLVAVLHRLRAEGGSPARQAIAVALGLLVGASPFYGFHLLLAVGLGTVFRLNRLKVYLAANISNPLVAPFLIVTEIQLGSMVRRGEWYTPSDVSRIHLQGLAVDVLLGNAILGGALAVVGGLATYSLLKRRRRGPLEPVIERAAERFLKAGIGPWEFASAKLRMDPVYLQVLSSGRLPRKGTLVDLGCGQGLMLALLASALEPAGLEHWPASGPRPPEALQLLGYERRPRVIRRARLALEGDATIESVDLRDAEFPMCDVVLLFDVLHMMPLDAQEQLLARVRGALRPGGLLAVREADRDAGWGFQLVRWSNWLRALAEGQVQRKFYFRTTGEWERLLCQAGFTVDPPVTSPGSTVWLANVLIYGVRRPDPENPSKDRTDTSTPGVS